MCVSVVLSHGWSGMGAEIRPGRARLPNEVPSFMSRFSELLMRAYWPARESCDLFMGSVSMDEVLALCMILEGGSGGEGRAAVVPSMIAHVRWLESPVSGRLTIADRSYTL
jgi:hypothetical protein